MKNYFQLQFKIMNRNLTEFGLPPVFVYSVAPFLFYFLSNELFKKIEYAIYLYSFLVFTFLFKLGEKKKNNFLKITFKKEEYYKIRVLENIFVLIPFISFLVFKEYYLVTITLFFIGAFLVFFSIKYNFNKTIKTPFYVHPFEFCTGFRVTYFIFIFAYFLTYISISVTNFNLGIFALLIVQLTCLNYYIKPESFFYVWIYSMSPKDFIKYKFKIIIKYSTLLCLPIVICLSVFFPSEILIIFGIFGLSYFLILTGMLAKYAAFPEKISIREGVILVFLFWFPPILVLIIPYLYLQSIKKLNQALI